MTEPARLNLHTFKDVKDMSLGNIGAKNDLQVKDYVKFVTSSALGRLWVQFKLRFIEKKGIDINEHTFNQLFANQSREKLLKIDEICQITLAKSNFNRDQPLFSKDQVAKIQLTKQKVSEEIQKKEQIIKNDFIPFKDLNFIKNNEFLNSLFNTYLENLNVEEKKQDLIHELKKTATSKVNETIDAARKSLVMMKNRRNLSNQKVFDEINIPYHKDVILNGFIEYLVENKMNDKFDADTNKKLDRLVKDNQCQEIAKNWRSNYKNTLQLTQLDNTVHTDPTGKVLVPTKIQLKKALKLAELEITKKFPELDPKEKKWMTARLAQLIMCEEKDVDKITPIDRAALFRVKELDDMISQQKPVSIESVNHSSFLDYHLNTSEGSLVDTIKEKLQDLSKDKKINWAAISVPKDINFSSKDLTPEKIKEYIRTHYTVYVSAGIGKRGTNKPLTEDELKILDNCVDQINIENLKMEIAKKGIKQYLNNFKQDHFSRPLNVKMGDENYKLFNEGEVNRFFTAFKQNYIKIISEDKDLSKTIENNKKLIACGINPNMSENEFKEILKSTEIPDEIKTQIIQLTTFSEEEITNILTKHPQLKKEDIEPLLRLKALQYMLVMNQSSNGLDVSKIDPQYENIDTRLKESIGANYIGLNENASFIISSDMNGLYGYQSLTPSNAEEGIVTYGKLDRTLHISSIIPDEEKTWGSMQEVTQAEVTIEGLTRFSQLEQALTDKKPIAENP